MQPRLKELRMSVCFRNFVGFALVGIGIIGCAPTVQLTVYSDPPYATLYNAADGNRLGQAPFTAEIPFTDDEAQRGHKRMGGITARWQSGASASLPGITLSLSKGKQQSATLFRPDTPGREMDVQYANQIRQQNINAALTVYQISSQQQIQQQQLRQRQAEVEAAQSATRSNSERGINCNSTNWGNGNVTTNCN